MKFSMAGMFLILVWVVTGCGTSKVPTYPVSGTVLFEDGSPVLTGTVELESRDHGLTAAGRIRDDGSFVLGTYTSNDGACAGPHKVIVMQLIVNDGTVNHTRNHGKSIDPKFSSYATSTLTATIKAVESNNLKLIVTAAGNQ